MPRGISGTGGGARPSTVQSQTEVSKTTTASKTETVLSSSKETSTSKSTILSTLAKGQRKMEGMFSGHSRHATLSKELNLEGKYQRIGKGKWAQTGTLTILSDQ